MSISTINPILGARDAAIKKAADHLSKGRIENLWKNEVTDAAWYKKVPGVVNYALKRYQAYASAKKFNNAASELVKAVAFRRLTKEEANSTGCPEVILCGAADQENYRQRQILVDQKVENFYKAFKGRINTLNVKSENLEAFIHGAEKILLKLSQSEALPINTTRVTLPEKISTTINSFNQEIFKDIVETCARLPLDQITPEKYIEVIDTLKTCFPFIGSSIIKKELNKAILATHGPEALSEITAECTNPSANSPRLVALKQRLTSALTEEKAALEAELQGLRGADGFNGTLNAAYQEMDAAQKAKDQLRADYIKARYEFGIASNNVDSEEGLLGLDDEVPGLRKIKSDFSAAVRTLKAKKEIYDKRNQRFQEIAQYQHGSSALVSGRLHELNQQLKSENLNNSIQALLQKQVRLYHSINRTVPTMVRLPTEQEPVQNEGGYNRRRARSFSFCG